jgi:hypothetical protein
VQHSSKGVLPSVLIILRNRRCEAAEVLIRTIEPLMMMMMMMMIIMMTHAKQMDHVWSVNVIAGAFSESHTFREQWLW